MSALCIVGQKCTPDLTIHGSSEPQGSRYSASNVLSQTCDIDDGTNANYFLGLSGSEDSYIIFDFGCLVKITSIELQNTNNNGQQSR